MKFDTRKMLTAAFAAVALTVGAGSAKADIILDSFNTPATPVTFSIGGSNPNGFTITNNLGTMTRSTVLTVATPLTPDFDSLTGSLGGGNFRMSLNGNSTGNAAITYSGFAGGSTNFIPTGVSGGLQLTFATVESGLGFTTLPVGVAITTATGTLSFGGFVTDTGATTTYDLPFSGFTGSGDLSQVTSFTLTLNGPLLSRRAAELQLDEIGLRTPPPPNEIPAPPAAFLVLAALPALGLRRLFRKPTVA